MVGQKIDLLVRRFFLSRNLLDRAIFWKKGPRHEGAEMPLIFRGTRANIQFIFGSGAFQSGSHVAAFGER